MAYDINYNDKRFTQVEADKNAAIKESDSTFDNMINQSDGYYQAQIDAAKQWGDTQAKNQQERTDFTIEQINQQKDQAHKDYLKEQSGAYVDWQKQSNQYGSNAEQMASSGLAHTGYSESSQVSMYNAYQNRVAMARASYDKAVLSYNNAIKDAQLQNNSVLAEIAYNTLQTSLELSLQGFQYKNQFVLEKANAKREIDNTYYSRYQNVLAQINHENSLAEQVRQYNANLAEEKRQYNQSYALQQQQLAEQTRQFNETMAYNKAKNGVGSSSGSSKNTKSKSSSSSSKKSSSSSKKSSSSSKKNTKTSSSKSGGLTVDKQSVINLGYGPISAKKLNSLVESGQVIEYESNGKLKYKKATQKTTKNNLLNKSNLPDALKRITGLK